MIYFPIDGCKPYTINILIQGRSLHGTFRLDESFLNLTHFGKQDSIGESIVWLSFGLESSIREWI